AQRAGAFTTKIFDPASSARIQFPNNTIPASRFDPLARQLLALYPVPNLPGFANNYARTGVEPDNQDEFDTRIDHSFTSIQHVFARYSFLRDDDTPVAPLPDGSGAIASGVISATLTRGDQIVAEHEWTLTPALLNQLRFGYSRRNSTGNGPLNSSLTLPAIPSNSFASALPTFNVTGFQQIGAAAGANSRFTTSVTEYLDTLSYIRGRHTVKFGADIRREALEVIQPPNPAGSYTFTTTGTNALGVAGSGNALASLLLGQVSAFSIDIQRRQLRERANIAEFFVGDDWKATNRLSLNLGTRYTRNFPSYEVDRQGAVFNLKTQTLDFPRTARNLECCDFGPRAGLAFRASNSLVVRSGYGLIWFEQTGISTPFTLPQFPFVQTIGQQTQDNINAAFLLSNGPAVRVSAPNPNSGLGQGVFGTQRGNGSGYSQQWNFTIQKTVGNNLNFEIGYLGSKNTRLGLPEANLNQLPSSDLALGSALLAKAPNPYYGQLPATSSLDTATIAEQQLLRAYPRFTTVALFRDNVGNSSYHSAQARLEKRFSNGLTFSLAYTFSKLIDDASSYFSQTIFTGPVLNGSGAADAFNRHLEKDLFRLAGEAVEADTVFLPNESGLKPGQPVQLGRVGKKLIASLPSPFPCYLPPADALVMSGAKVRLIRSEGFENRVVVAGCDPGISVLARHARAAGIELVLVHRNSSQSLDLLKKGCIHIAGSHLRDSASGESNLPQIGKMFPNKSVAVISLAWWEEGIVTAPNNPKAIQTVEDFARTDVSIVNCEKGAGARLLLDGQLASLKMKALAVRGYQLNARGHLEAAGQVAKGAADCCIAPRVAAQSLGLGFIPLVRERYDLAIAKRDLSTPAIETLFDIVNRAGFRRELANLGYDTGASGQRML
ncbi:MAG: hypothetical protein M3Y07_03750, partial [Acidobacteriota bacterium]|nr:hypothetical protein [Acidobacteriota bacterium]